MRSSVRVLLALALLTACSKSDDKPAPTGDKTKPTADGTPAKPRSETITVAAASDLSFAFTEVGKAWEAKTGNKVVFSFSSTGQLTKQIQEGAPFDLLAAANVSFADEAIASGSCLADTKALYGRGRIVLWTSKDGPAAPAKIEDLTDKRFVKIALANPEHAPYGKAAKQAIEGAGLWKQLEPKIVYAENIKQTMQFAQTGNAEAAFIALSLAIIDDTGVYLEIDEKLYAPLDQALVVCKGGGHEAAARDFATYVNSEEGRAIMKKFGFLLPGEAAPAK
jgi:molybdate transport system substrate-binding protein